MTDFYTQPTIPLTYTRLRGQTFVTGLTVTVTVKEQRTDALLLASMPVPETASGSGVYTYAWTHGLLQDTACVVTYTVNGFSYRELIYVSGGGYGPGRAT